MVPGGINSGVNSLGKISQQPNTKNTAQSSFTSFTQSLSGAQQDSKIQEKTIDEKLISIMYPNNPENSGKEKYQKILQTIKDMVNGNKSKNFDNSFYAALEKKLSAAGAGYISRTVLENTVDAAIKTDNTSSTKNVINKNNPKKNNITNINGYNIDKITQTADRIIKEHCRNKCDTISRFISLLDDLKYDPSSKKTFEDIEKNKMDELNNILLGSQELAVLNNRLPIALIAAFKNDKYMDQPTANSIASSVKNPDSKEGKYVLESINGKIIEEFHNKMAEIKKRFEADHAEAERNKPQWQKELSSAVENYQPGHNLEAVKDALKNAMNNLSPGDKKEILNNLVGKVLEDGIASVNEKTNEIKNILSQFGSDIVTSQDKKDIIGKLVSEIKGKDLNISEANNEINNVIDNIGEGLSSGNISALKAEHTITDWENKLSDFIEKYTPHNNINKEELLGILDKIPNKEQAKIETLNSLVEKVMDAENMPTLDKAKKMNELYTLFDKKLDNPQLCKKIINKALADKAQGLEEKAQSINEIISLFGKNTDISNLHQETISNLIDKSLKSYNGTKGDATRVAKEINNIVGNTDGIEVSLNPSLNSLVTKIVDQKELTVNDKLGEIRDLETLLNTDLNSVSLYEAEINKILEDKVKGLGEKAKEIDTLISNSSLNKDKSTQLRGKAVSNLIEKSLNSHEGKIGDSGKGIKSDTTRITEELNIIFNTLGKDTKDLNEMKNICVARLTMSQLLSINKENDFSYLTGEEKGGGEGIEKISISYFQEMIRQNAIEIAKNIANELKIELTDDNINDIEAVADDFCSKTNPQQSSTSTIENGDNMEKIKKYFSDLGTSFQENWSKIKTSLQEMLQKLQEASIKLTKKATALPGTVTDLIKDQDPNNQS